MSLEEIEKNLCLLVEKSLSNRQLKEEFVFELSQKSINIAWKYYFIDLKNYSCKVHSDEIRHIYKEHQEEVYHICKIHYYLEHFKSIKRSKTRDSQTGRDIPCFEFIKQLEDKKVKIVKLNISRSKILSLKTLFEVV